MHNLNNFILNRHICTLGLVVEALNGRHQGIDESVSCRLFQNCARHNSLVWAGGVDSGLRLSATKKDQGQVMATQCSTQRSDRRQHLTPANYEARHNNANQGYRPTWLLVGIVPLCCSRFPNWYRSNLETIYF